ncbi:hypothetical protein CCHR01_03638 [Colletotrichum chrysophilum]|uniref:Uncharacterized protein n=1 Tax=Colletotrichum chrysophilum TaxID=1836956 RepID=A0AAD9AXU9_9PEZI|nr:hypothetical protein CCHR01_03638 [Colletotrichum chrysophilum]
MGWCYLAQHKRKLVRRSAGRRIRLSLLPQGEGCANIALVGVHSLFLGALGGRLFDEHVEAQAHYLASSRDWRWPRLRVCGLRNPVR